MLSGVGTEHILWGAKFLMGSLAIVCLSIPSHASQKGMPTVIRGAMVFDGSGEEGMVQDVRIESNVIVAVGKLTLQEGEAFLDGSGLVLAPGFIDTHSHHNFGLVDHPRAEKLTSQGVTTVIFGQDGAASNLTGSSVALSLVVAELKSHDVAVNYAYYAGHNTIRSRVMGQDWNREATPDELQQMKALLIADMEAGALGLSTGLEYSPGRAASTAELVVLAQESRRFGGRYISHMRNEDDNILEAVEEVVTIGRSADIPVQISHLKLGGVNVLGKGDELLARLNSARASGVDITADIYPYEYWFTAIVSLYSNWEYENIEETRYLLEHLVRPDGIIIADYKPDPGLKGRTLASIAEEYEQDPAILLNDMIEATGGANSDFTVAGRSMQESDIKTLIAWPYSNVCSDGAFDSSHPRGAGAFSRVLRRYTRETGTLTLSEAIRKMSGLAAENMGFTDRGYIRPGYQADLVLFDPARVTDNATFENPSALADGVEKVWINGIVVWNGEATGELPGQFLTRGGRSEAH